MLSADVKIVPVLQPHRLDRETTRTVEAQPAARHAAGAGVLGLLLFSVRTALIVAVTIPFSLLFAFICLDWAHIPANLLSMARSTSA